MSIRRFLYALFLLCLSGCDVNDPIAISQDLAPAFALTPAAKLDCKKGGWASFGFRNQGQCVRFVETGFDGRELSIPTDGLVAWYPFDGSYDNSFGSGPDLVNQNGSFVTDRHGNSASAVGFNTLDGELVGDWPSFPLTDVSISLWFRLEDLPVHNSYALLMFGRNKAGPWANGLHLGIDENWGARGCAPTSGYTVAVQVAAQGALGDPCTPGTALQVWNHVVLIVADGNARWYLNGVEQAAFSYIAPIPTVNSVLRIGSHNNFPTSVWTRFVDDVAIWDRALSSTEIAGLSVS